MEKTKRARTNEALLKLLIRELSYETISLAIVRERLLHIMQLTYIDASLHPERWNTIISASEYVRIAKRTAELIGFGEEIPNWDQEIEANKQR